MSKYYNFIALNINQTEVVWSEPYVDGNGLGNMTTAAFPIYYNKSNSSKILLGVVGIDILMSELTAYNLTRNAIVEKLIIKSSKCKNVNFSFCEFENLRGEEKCDIMQCRNNDIVDIINPETCSTPISNNVLCNNSVLKKTSNIIPCCGLNSKKCYESPLLNLAIKKSCKILHFFILLIYLYNFI